MLHSGFQLNVGFGTQGAQNCAPNHRSRCGQGGGPLGGLIRKFTQLLSRLLGGGQQPGRCCSPNQNPCFGNRAQQGHQAQFGMNFSANFRSFLG